MDSLGGNTLVPAKNHRNKSLHNKIIVQSCVTPEPEQTIGVGRLSM